MEKLEWNVISACIDTESDPVLIRACEKASDNGRENGSDARELFLKVPMSDEELEALVSMQKPDGSWPDIDYKDANRGIWQLSFHAFRVNRLAIKFCRGGGEKALSAALSAMDYWFAHTPEYPGWWHKEVGIPRLMGPAFVMLKKQMSDAQLHEAIALMSAAQMDRTGQNKVWLSGNVLLRAVLQEDVPLALQARNAILSELRFSTGQEGLQEDYSFHQHGPQLQFGNYGLSYAVTLSWWARVLAGTGLDFSPEQLDLLRNYLQRGLFPLCWNGWFDPNACGRHVFPNAQSGKALCLRYAARNLELPFDSEAVAVYYPLSDFGVYRTKNWYASIRMQSSRTLGFETTNEENMKGYFSADGALLVRVSGDEYEDVWPYWDWHHIPGVTAWDDGTPLWGTRSKKVSSKKQRYNHSPWVSGLSRDGYMIAAMDYNRDSLTARKAWFMFDKGIICLGAGISRPGAAEVTTAIEQNLLKGPMKIRKNCASHRGICYFLLGNAEYSAGKVTGNGKWQWMSPALPDSLVSAPLFKMVIHHGPHPADASYAYAIIPDSCLSRARKSLLNIKILCNTKERQSVSLNGDTLTVVWEPFSLTINGKNN